MLQRCGEHDYCAPSFYMITIVTEPRRGCLSELHPGGGAPSDARLTLSPIGELVRNAWLRTSSIYPGVEACEWVMMPDHFHGVLWVKERLLRHMGHIVKAFKRVSTQEYRSKGLLLPPNQSKGLFFGSVSAAAPAADLQSTLWQDGFQDSILLRKGQLAAMVNYIADNPRRLAAKQANPELFTVVSTQPVGRGRSCAAIGNHYLLDRPLKRQVQISRTVSRDQLANLKDELLYAAVHGAVLVSPCLRPGRMSSSTTCVPRGPSSFLRSAPPARPNGCGSKASPENRAACDRACTVISASQAAATTNSNKSRPTPMRLT